MDRNRCCPTPTHPSGGMGPLNSSVRRRYFSVLGRCNVYHRGSRMANDVRKRMDDNAGFLGSLGFHCFWFGPIGLIIGALALLGVIRV